MGAPVIAMAAGGHDPPVRSSRRLWPMARSSGDAQRTEISVPAENRQVRVLRLVTASTMSLYAFGVDAVEDVRSAVDESCALVLGSHGAEGRLSLVLDCDDNCISVVIRGDFDVAPVHGNEDDLRAEQMLRPFVDRCDIDLVRHRVSFDVNV